MELNHLDSLPPSLHACLHTELVEPAIEFLNRSSKGIRRQLVNAGFTWAAKQKPDPDQLRFCQELGHALELVHSASLIIDDIQDNRPMRRGRESVHLIIGIGKAINVANWLYFKALDHVDRLSVSADKRLKLQSIFRTALLDGHAGQALDLGIPIRKMPKESVVEVCQASVVLKTGALTSLAFAAGAVIADLPENEISLAEDLGEEIGVILQSLDDLKNLKADPLAQGKRFEDLHNQRPSLVWLLAAQNEHPECWGDLDRAVGALPANNAFDKWLVDYRILEGAQAWIEERIQNLRQKAEIPEELNQIINQLVKAYEKI